MLRHCDQAHLKTFIPFTPSNYNFLTLDVANAWHLLLDDFGVTDCSVVEAAGIILVNFYSSSHILLIDICTALQDESIDVSRANVSQT